MKIWSIILISAVSVLRHGAAAPTWPSSVDELEDIMLLNTGYRARGFSGPVSPCSKAPGPGRVAAAEFIRTAFHGNYEDIPLAADGHGMIR